MADNIQAIEWYLARDGQQHGPVTDAELQKIIELGYLRPTDLVWRQGMAEWAAAETVLDLSSAPVAAPAPQHAQPQPAPQQPAQVGAKPAAPSEDRGPGMASGDERAPHSRLEPEPAAPRQAEGHQRGLDPRQQAYSQEAEHRARAAVAAPQGYAPQAYAPQQQPGSQAAPGPHAPYGGGHVHPSHGGQAARAGHPGGAPTSIGAGPRRDESAQPGAAMKGPAVYPGGPRADRPVHSGGERPDRSMGARAEPADDLEEDDGEPRGFPWRTAIILIVLAVLAAGGFALYKSGKLASLPFLAAPTSPDAVPVVNRPSAPVRDAGTKDGSPVLSGDGQAIDAGLQKVPLWKLLKREFPDWYQERTTEIARLASESKNDREISALMTRSVVELRRRHQAEALVASPARLKSIASSFVDNLAQLARESTAACYGYISQGESSPVVVDLKKPEQRAAIDAQLVTIFDAVAEGRKTPTRRDAPRREDYDLLSGELGKRGWSAADLQLFTDPRALARAAPEKVCQMVQDWFAAQLSIEDEAAKIRLLGEALKPVVAG